MKYEILKTIQVKNTRYEIVRQADKETIWVIKIAQSGKVSFLQPYRNLESANKGFNNVIS
jgi:hypothetical protein